MLHMEDRHALGLGLAEAEPLLGGLGRGCSSGGDEPPGLESAWLVC